MQSLQQIRAMLEARGLSPRHALGQNFLIDQNLVAKLVDAAHVQPAETILEVGPGTGTLTDALLHRGCRVIACEMDTGLAQLLRDRLLSPASPAASRFTLIEGDCLASGKRLNEHAAAALAGSPFKLVANLPYQAATPLMLSLLIDHPLCSLQAVTIQREVADRLLAPPGSKDYGLLGIVAQAMGEVSLIAKLPPECFWPRPKVHSAMVLIRRREKPLTDQPANLARFCQTLFSKRRKQLGAILGRSLPFPASINPTQRPEELSPTQIIELMHTAHLHAPINPADTNPA